MSTVDLRMSGVCLTFSWFTSHRNRGVKHELVFNTESNKYKQYFCDKFIVLVKKGFTGVPPPPYIWREFTVTVVTDVETEFIILRCSLACMDSEIINFFLLIFFSTLSGTLKVRWKCCGFVLHNVYVLLIIWDIKLMQLFLGACVWSIALIFEPLMLFVDQNRR